MVTLDKPLPTHRPKHRFRQAADRASFNARWMNEQKEAAFASNDEFMIALKEKELLEPERSYQPQRFER